ASRASASCEIGSLHNLMVGREHFVAQFAEAELGAAIRRPIRLLSGGIGVCHVAGSEDELCRRGRLESPTKAEPGPPFCCDRASYACAFVEIDDVSSEWAIH